MTTRTRPLLLDVLVLETLQQLVCVETVLTDEKKVWDNVKDAKLKSPDYKGMTAEEAMEVTVFCVVMGRHGVSRRDVGWG